MLVVTGVGAFVLLAVLATNGGSVRMSPSPSPGTDGSAAAAATAHPEATSDLSRFTDPGEFPNAAEADLLDHLLARVADRCERADPADTPILRFSPDEGQPRTTEPLRTRAGVDCLVDGVRVHYWQAAGSGGYQAHLGFASDLLLNTARRLSIGEGDCADSSRVYGPWEAAGHDGLVLCYVGTDGAAMHWSFDDANIYATATRRDGDTAKLYQWWREIGRLLTA